MVKIYKLRLSFNLSTPKLIRVYRRNWIISGNLKSKRPAPVSGHKPCDTVTMNVGKGTLKPPVKGVYCSPWNFLPSSLLPWGSQGGHWPYLESLTKNVCICQISFINIKLKQSKVSTKLDLHNYILYNWNKI